MQKIQDKPFFNWPRAMPSDFSKRDSDKYYFYHKDHENMTEKCNFLKFFLEDLVKKGHIQKFMKEVTKQKKEFKPAK